MCLELPEFLGFSLLLKPIPGRDSQHCTPLGTALPSCATAQPGGALSHRPGHALGWGSSRSPPAARVCRAGWKGWSAQRKGSGRSVQEVSSKPRGEAAWAEMLQMCRALRLCALGTLHPVLLLTPMFSDPAVPTSNSQKSPQTGFHSSHHRMLVAQGSDE